MEERNKEVIRRFYKEFFNDHIVESADRYVREDYVQHNPGVGQGREAFENRHLRKNLKHILNFLPRNPDVDRRRKYGCGLSEKCRAGRNNKMSCR